MCTSAFECLQAATLVLHKRGKSLPQIASALGRNTNTIARTLVAYWRTENVARGAVVARLFVPRQGQRDESRPSPSCQPRACVRCASESQMCSPDRKQLQDNSGEYGHRRDSAHWGLGARAVQRPEIPLPPANLSRRAARARPVLSGARPMARPQSAHLPPARAAATVPLEIGDEVERVQVVALQRYGKRLTVILDRARQKRCDFQIVEKAYKDPEPSGPTTYEQIFWFTQTAMQQRRPRGVRLRSSLAPAEARVRIASDERYPWSFGGFATERGPLPAGDNALLDSNQIVAVVERKTPRGAAGRLRPDGRPTSATAGADGVRTARRGLRSALRGPVES